MFARLRLGAAALSVALACALLSAPASAALNLVATCTHAAVVLGAAECGDKWLYTASPAGKVVRSLGKWLKFDGLASTAPVTACGVDIPEGHTGACSTLVSIPKSQVTPPATPPPADTSLTTTFRFSRVTFATNAQPLGGAEPTYYRLKCGQVAGGPWPIVQRVEKGTQLPPADYELATLTFPQAGTWRCVVTAVLASGVESAPSNEVTRVIAGAAVATAALSCALADGIESVIPTCTWVSTNAAACVASGAWSGAKASAGTESLPALRSDARLVIDCNGAQASVAIGVSPRPQAPVVQ